MSRMRKDLLFCVQSMLGKNKFLVQFKYGQYRYISASFLTHVCSKQEVGQEVDENISDPPSKIKCKFLAIHGDPVGEGYGMFEKCVHFHIFYCLLFF